MAITEEVSTQASNKDAAPPVMNDRADVGGDLHAYHFDHAQAVVGDDGSSVLIARLPAGKVRMFGALSFIAWSALGASRVVDIGHKAYVDQDGAAVAANLIKYDSNIDMSAAGEAAMGSDAAAASGDSFVFDSRDGVDIVLTCTGGTIGVGETFNGDVVYQGGQ